MDFFENFNGKLEEVRKDAFYKPCMESLRDEFEKLREKPLLCFTYSDYMEFFKSGNRFDYDERIEQICKFFK